MKIVKISILFIVFLIIAQCGRNLDSERIWVGSEVFFKGIRLGSNKAILNFKNLKSYHVGLMEYNDSIHIKDSINIKGYVWKFKNRRKDKMVYEFNKDTSYTMTFMQLKKAESDISFDKVLSKKWYRTLIEENESFVIDEDYDITYPQLTISRYYYLDQVPVYSEREFYKLDTLTISNNHFLVLKQNNAIFLDQIMQFDNSNLSLFNYNSFHGSDRKFTDAPIDKKEASFKNVQNFEVCNGEEIDQYYYNRMRNRNSRNKQEMISYFLENYDYPFDSSENGYIRIRFIVNCKGEMGRFSIQEMDRNYMEKRFPLEITQQLFVLITQLDGWIPNKWEQNDSDDYYIHIGFKIKNGQIDEILP